MPGAFLRHQTLFHLFEVGLNVFLYFRESLNSPERADDLLQKKKKKLVLKSAQLIVEEKHENIWKNSCDLFSLHI